VASYGKLASACSKNTESSRGERARWACVRKSFANVLGLRGLYLCCLYTLHR
jgi:hypothetical protein